MPFTGLKSIDLKHAVDALDIALAERDQYTRDHCNRLISISEKTGSLCGLSTEELHIVKLAALFHDIGKIGIPDDILRKPLKLDPAEWETMKTHTVKGERIVETLNIRNGESVANFIRHHHEHFNGNGYPDGLSGESIPFGARIISVADSYDAMTSNRGYAYAKTHEETLLTMYEEEGEKSDPYVFRNFIKVVGNGAGQQKPRRSGTVVG